MEDTEVSFAGTLIFGLIVLLAVFLWDKYSYDHDLEQAHIRETGHTWKEIEGGLKK